MNELEGRGIFLLGSRSYPETLNLYLQHAIESLGGKVAGLDPFGGQVIRGPTGNANPQPNFWGERGFTPDLLIAIKPRGLVRENFGWDFKDQNGGKVKTILYWPDPLEEEGVQQYLYDMHVGQKYYDYLFTCCKGPPEVMKRLDAHWLPVGFAPELYKPIEPGTLTEYLDVVFIGTKRPGREFIPKLRPPVWIYGNGWQNEKAGYATDHIMKRDIYLAEKRKVMGSAKLQLNQHYKFTKDGSGAGPNHRFFENLATKRPQISDVIPEMRELGFYEKVHFFSYDSVEDLKEQLPQLLDQPFAAQRRREVAEEGYRKLIEGKHSYADRVLSMCKTIDLN